MSSDTYNCWSLAIQAVVAVAMVLTLLIYYRLLQQTKKGNESQALLTVIQFLQQPQNREAREYCLTNLSAKKYSQWNDIDRKYAAEVCSSYGTAGLLLKGKRIESHLLFEGYGPSIKRCYEILGPYIAEKQKESEPDYWGSFEWLYEATKERQ